MRIQNHSEYIKISIVYAIQCFANDTPVYYKEFMYVDNKGKNIYSLISSRLNVIDFCKLLNEKSEKLYIKDQSVLQIKNKKL